MPHRARVGLAHLIQSIKLSAAGLMVEWSSRGLLQQPTGSNRNQQRRC